MKFEKSLNEASKNWAITSLLEHFANIEPRVKFCENLAEEKIDYNEILFEVAHQGLGIAHFCKRAKMSRSKFLNLLRDDLEFRNNYEKAIEIQNAFWIDILIASLRDKTIDKPMLRFLVSNMTRFSFSPLNKIYKYDYEHLDNPQLSVESKTSLDELRSELEAKGIEVNVKL